MDVGENFFVEVSKYVDIYKQIFKDYSYLKGHGLNNHFRALISIMDSGLPTFEWRACTLAFARKFGRDVLYDFCLKIEKVTLTHAVNGIRKDERYADFIALLSLIEHSKTAEDCLGAIKYDENAITNRLVSDDIYKKPYEKYVLLSV